MSGMLLHCGAKGVSREDLRRVVVPEGTATWRPVGHGELVDLVSEVAMDFGWRLEEEKFGMTPDGARMFGVLYFQEVDGERSLTLGVRNSMDKTLAAGLAVGNRVFVCDNLVFSSDLRQYYRRHTPGWDIPAWIEEALGYFDQQAGRLQERLEYLKREFLVDDAAKLKIFEAAERDLIRPSDILAIYQEYKEPRHEEFREPTAYNLLMAFTEISKKYSTNRQLKFHGELGRLFIL